MATEIVNMHDAKSRLSELIRAVEAGDDVIVARNGKPVAKLIPWPGEQMRTSGSWAGRIDGDLDDIGSDAEVAALFEASANAPTP